MRSVEARAFEWELKKLAAPKALVSALPTVLTGAGAGGLWQGVEGYQQARSEGQGILPSAVQGLQRGAAGAAAGAALGGGLHAATGLPGWIGRRAASLDKSVAQYGKHQAHVVTGRGSLADIGAGSTVTGSAVEQARRAAVTAAAEARAVGRGGNVSKFKQWKADRRAASSAKNVDSAERAHQAALNAERMGVTSIPGTIRGIREHGWKPMARAAVDYQWNSIPTSSKALMLGIPLGLGAATAHQGGEGAYQQTGELAGNFAGQLLPHTNPVSFGMSVGPWARYAPTNLISAPFEVAGGYIGRGVGSLVRRKDQQ